MSEIKINQPFVLRVRQDLMIFDSGARVVTVQFLDNRAIGYRPTYTPQELDGMPVLFTLETKKPEILSGLIKDFVRAKQFLSGVDTGHTCGKS